MRGRGITYDTGFYPGGRSSRELFDPEIVRREMRVIAVGDDPHCTAVRVTGGDAERLALADTTSTSPRTGWSRCRMTA